MMFVPSFLDTFGYRKSKIEAHSSTIALSETKTTPAAKHVPLPKEDSPDQSDSPNEPKPQGQQIYLELSGVLTGQLCSASPNATNAQGSLVEGMFVAKPASTPKPDSTKENDDTTTKGLPKKGSKSTAKGIMISKEDSIEKQRSTVDSTTEYKSSPQKDSIRETDLVANTSGTSTQAHARLGGEPSKAIKQGADKSVKVIESDLIVKATQGDVNVESGRPTYSIPGDIKTHPILLKTGKQDNVDMRTIVQAIQEIPQQIREMQENMRRRSEMELLGYLCAQQIALTCSEEREIKPEHEHVVDELPRTEPTKSTLVFLDVLKMDDKVFSDTIKQEITKLVFKLWPFPDISAQVTLRLRSTLPPRFIIKIKIVYGKDTNVARMETKPKRSKAEAIRNLIHILENRLEMEGLKKERADRRKDRRSKRPAFIRHS